MHVDDVGAERDVDRARDADPVRGQDQAVVGVFGIEILEMLPEGPAEAELVVGAETGGHREGVGRVADHAELPLRKLGRDVLARLAGDRQLEIVDRRGAVHGDGRRRGRR